MTRRVEVGAHLRELKETLPPRGGSVSTLISTYPPTLREPSPLLRTGVPRDPREPVPARPDLQLTEGTARWCGHCAAPWLAHYENFGLRCAACGYATQPLSAESGRGIDVVLPKLSTDRLRTVCGDALMKVWAQHAALANRPSQPVRRYLGDPPRSWQ